MAGERLDQRYDAPPIGADGREILAEAGMAQDEIDGLVADGIVVISSERR
jgi:crotonobetainyl-CoA:carnitine CoA-transferase CaiB-like acyl-CoA transferase